MVIVLFPEQRFQNYCAIILRSEKRILNFNKKVVILKEIYFENCTHRHSVETHSSASTQSDSTPI